MNVYTKTFKITKTEKKLTEIKEGNNATFIDLIESLAQYILKVSLNSGQGGRINA